MKKIYMTTLCIVMTFGFVGCGTSTEVFDKEVAKEEQVSEAVEQDDMAKLKDTDLVNKDTEVESSTEMDEYDFDKMGFTKYQYVLWDGTKIELKPNKYGYNYDSGSMDIEGSEGYSRFKNITYELGTVSIKAQSEADFEHMSYEELLDCDLYVEITGSFEMIPVESGTMGDRKGNAQMVVYEVYQQGIKVAQVSVEGSNEEMIVETNGSFSARTWEVDIYPIDNMKMGDLTLEKPTLQNVVRMMGVPSNVNATHYFDPDKKEVQYLYATNVGGVTFDMNGATSLTVSSYGISEYARFYGNEEGVIEFIMLGL